MTVNQLIEQRWAMLTNPHYSVDVVFTQPEFVTDGWFAFARCVNYVRPEKIYMELAARWASFVAEQWANRDRN